ncbi:MAG: hypothetical protein GC200_03300 [Tepidisphaera sp.]|nr:hypothetical protein [Tepidisphaera sp.]
MRTDTRPSGYSSRRRSPAVPVAFVVMLLLGGLALSGCHKNDPLLEAAALTNSVSGGRTAGSAALVKSWKAGDLKLDAAMNLAFDYLESAKDNRPLKGTTVIVPSANATNFAGAVLDALEQVQSQLPQAGEFEIFWMRVGGLAFAAAEEAHAAGRVAEARTLVFAGGKRWQNDAYWQGHSAHDGLASVILAKSGERAEAIARLRDRADLNGVAAEVYEMLQKGQ